MWPFSSPAKPEQAQEATSMDGTYKPMGRDERKQCWAARDEFFSCLDKNGILDAIANEDAAKAKCKKEEEEFENSCAHSWVKYFKQKRVADFNKEQQIKKLEAEGAVPMSSGSTPSKWKFW